ncbi:hypothetical protein Pst134EB_021958 [Puccinia striiformis f. sp. tritici]|nr:hypothetical protein Pst134EB_021958 [Puccinia striiformis f. sp. tritici]
MASINDHPDLPSSPTQRKTNKRRSSSKAAGSQPLEVEINNYNDKPTSKPAKKPCKANKKKAQVVTSEIDDQVQETSGAANKEKSQVVTSEIDNQVQEDSGAPEDVKKNSGSCSGNYITAEDVQMCNSWLETMEDPLHSTNQSGATFWDQVWLNKGKNYNHLQCYHILSVAQKWRDYCEKLDQKRLADLKKNTQSSDNPQSDLASDTTTIPAAKCDETSRPPGNKKAKDDRAQELKDTKWKDDLVKVNCDLAKHSQSQAAILAEQKDASVAMSDEATMLIDPNNIPEGKHKFFEWRQHKVMAKIMKAKAVEAQKKKEEEEKKNKEEEVNKIKEEEEKTNKDEEEKKKKKDKGKDKKKTTAAKKKTVSKTTEEDRRAAEAKTQEEDKAAQMILEVGDAIETDEEEEGEGEVDDDDDDEEDEEGEIKIVV